jgi:hypothetical protein
MFLKGWALVSAVTLVVGLAASAFAIVSFQVGFEWGDMS